jgi:hypothetical protein
MHRSVAILTAAALVLTLAACGDDASEGKLHEDTVRACLADNGLGRDRGSGATGYAPLYLREPPDFTAYAVDGTQVDVIVQGSPEKAQLTAADIRAALQGLSGGDDSQVVVSRNVVAVFSDAPSDEMRRAVEGCLD